VRTAGGDGWLRVLWVGVVVVYVTIIVASLPRAGRADYDQFLVFYELQYWNASLFGVVKQWTPVLCGGLSMAGEPQIPFASLNMLLAYALGPSYGPRLAILVYLAVGWAGMFLYAGLWLERPLARRLAASLFIGNGFFLARLCHGHLDLVPFLALPLALWALHRSVAWERQRLGWRGVPRLLLAISLLGAGIGMVVDGAPVAFVHWLVWIALYALVLAVAARSVAPPVILGAAIVLAAVLDAGYVWPMLLAQENFPRLTPDTFTSPLSLLWFMLLPVRGKLIPAPANGHELSVFIGPVVAMAIWRYRRELRDSLNAELRWPLAVVAAASIVLGMGSLHLLHVPVWLSPFDLLRPLPGFRSVGVTGRFWGFLAVPLSLLGAAALVRLADEGLPRKRVRKLLVFAVLLQLGAEVESVSENLLFSRRYHPVPYRQAFAGGPQTIEFATTGGRDMGELITPLRGVIDCYDEDDFTRPAMDPGVALVRAVRLGSVGLRASARPLGEFVTWSHIRILPATVRAAAPRTRGLVEVELNQAYHTMWSTGNGAGLVEGEQGNLTVVCSLDRLERAPLELIFHDPVSNAGVRASIIAWTVLGLALPMLIAACRFVSRRAPPVVC
jgi:hypothetical protein